MTVAPSRVVRIVRVVRLAPLLFLLICLSLSACGSSSSDSKTFALVTLFPTTGSDGAVGQALQQAVALAVKQNASLGSGYKVVVQNIDESSALREGQLATALATPQVMGIVGPYDSQTVLDLQPEIAAAGVVTVSPTATLPGLTQSAAATAEGVPFAQIHPSGKPLSFFRLAPSDTTMGKAAADLAVAPTASHGLAANAVFIVDDATASGKVAAAAFAAELKAKGGTVAGQQSLTLGAYDNSEQVANAIIDAYPDLVFFAGNLTAGATLRSTLSLTGVPQLPILAAGPVADNPNWSKTVGESPLLSSPTMGILPAANLTGLSSAKDFLSAWQATYQNATPVPQAALAYDAAMTEIAALKSAVASGKPVTRSAVATALAAIKLDGATGTIGFDQNGDSTAAPAFSVYTCDTKGAWSYQTALHG